MASRSRRFRFPRKDRRAAHSRAVTRIAGAEFGAAGSRGETFPGCKALKSQEMGMESAVTKAANQRSLMFVRCTGRLSVAHVTMVQSTVDELMHGEADAKIFSLATPWNRSKPEKN